jgi:hypothetical protein
MIYSRLDLSLFLLLAHLANKVPELLLDVQKEA